MKFFNYSGNVYLQMFAKLIAHVYTCVYSANQAKLGQVQKKLWAPVVAPLCEEIVDFFKWYIDKLYNAVFWAKFLSKYGTGSD